MRLHVCLVFICLGLLSTGLIACGDSGPSDAERRAAAAKKAKAKARAQAQARSEKCRDQLSGLLAGLKELESRIQIGMSYDEYTDQVADVNVAYNQVPFGQLDFGCVSKTGMPAEEALNSYADAADTWSECFSDFDCSLDSIDPELQKDWNRAGSQLDDAQSGLVSIAHAG